MINMYERKKRAAEKKAQGYKYWRVIGMFGGKERPYFCHAKTEEEAISLFHKVMGAKYSGIKYKSIKEVGFWEA